MTTTYLWYLTRGAGAVSLVLLSAVTMLGILSAARYEAPGWPRFVTTGFHRNLALLAVVFLGIHIVTAVVDPYTSLGWSTALLPFLSSYRTFWLGLGTVAFDLLLALVVTSLLRRLIGQPAWRAIHWAAYACWPIAVLHGFGTGTDAFSLWLLVIQSASILAVVAAIVARLALPPRDPLAEERARFRQSVRSRGDR